MQYKTEYKYPKVESLVPNGAMGNVLHISKIDILSDILLLVGIIIISLLIVR